jgi:hypothetical protein
MRKNILVIKCFGVFSKVIARVCLESRLAAARTISPERRRANLTATLVRVQGGASPAVFAHPISGRQITERRELSLPPGTDCRSKSIQKCVIRFDANLGAESCQCATRGNCGIGEPLCGWTRERVHGPAITQAKSAADWPRGEIVGATGLLAGILFHQVRPANRSGADARQRSSSDDPRPAPVLVTSLELGLRSAPSSKPHILIAQTGSPDPSPGTIEILFTELAWRRLRSLATRKSP